MSTVYALTIPDLLVTDGIATALHLHDLPQDDSELHTAALVASGDYFVTLAAVLEQVAAALPETHIQQLRLQAIVDQLLYLQDNYKIVKKS